MTYEATGRTAHFGNACAGHNNWYCRLDWRTCWEIPISTWLWEINPCLPIKQVRLLQSSICKTLQILSGTTLAHSNCCSHSPYRYTKCPCTESTEIYCAFSTESTESAWYTVELPLKLLVLVQKALCDLAPEYISEMLIDLTGYQVQS